MPPPTADGSAPDMNAQDLITRIRISYSKGPGLRFTGHLDMQRMWERLLRRSGLPIRYSQGYNPRARLNLASALPLGFTSEAELLDFWMDEPRPFEEIYKKLTASAPPDLVINAISQVPLSEDSLQSQMRTSQFIVEFFDPQAREALQEKVEAVLASDSLERTRRSKTYNLRPLILSLEVVHAASGNTCLLMELNAQPGATGRPDEVLDEIGFQNTDYLVSRRKLTLVGD